jgi:hypothetical protein
MTFRRGAALLSLAAGALLAACTSSGDGGTSPSSGASLTSAQLSSRITSGAAGLTSAHLKVSLNVAGIALSGPGVEKLADSAVAAMDISLTSSTAGDVRVISIGDQTYAKLPTSLNQTGKPYLAITPHSTNSTVNLLAPYVGAARAAVSPGELGELVAAAPTVEVKGSESVAGVDTTHYALKPDLARLDPQTSADLAIPGHSLPLDLWVSSDDKVIRALLGLDVQDQEVPIDITFTDFNQPVTITAPPASQVSG